MSRHLIDPDEDVLEAAHAELRTITTAAERERQVAVALDVLAGAELGDRSGAWRSDFANGPVHLNQ